MMSEQQPQPYRPDRLVPHITMRKVWFETGGADIFGDATPEELAAASLARSLADKVSEPKPEITTAAEILGD